LSDHNHNAQLADRRLELAAFAARTAQANQPRHLVILAGVIALAGLVTLISAWTGYAAAKAELRKERATADHVVRLAGDLRTLIEDEARAGPTPAEGGQRVLTRIEQASVEAGLTSPARAPLRTASNRIPNTNVVRVTRDYEVRDPDLGKIIAWIKRSTSQVPGLEVSAIVLKPEPQQWYARITFTRLERAEGT
jgi:hypothetical protein